MKSCLAQFCKEFDSLSCSRLNKLLSLLRGKAVRWPDLQMRRGVLLAYGLTVGLKRVVAYADWEPVGFSIPAGGWAFSKRNLGNRTEPAVEKVGMWVGDVKVKLTAGEKAGECVACVFGEGFPEDEIRVLGVMHGEISGESWDVGELCEGDVVALFNKVMDSGLHFKDVDGVCVMDLNFKR